MVFQLMSDVKYEPQSDLGKWLVQASKHTHVQMQWSHNEFMGLTQACPN